MSSGDPLPAEIVLSAAEARTVYLAVVAALDELAPVKLTTCAWRRNASSL